MRYITVRALWACADVLEIVRDGLIILAARVVAPTAVKAWHDDERVPLCLRGPVTGVLYVPDTTEEMDGLIHEGWQRVQ